MKILLKMNLMNLTIFKKAFIFNISEKKYGSVFDYFSFMKYLEEHITSEERILCWRIFLFR